MGQGDPGRQHQGGVIRAIPAEYSVTFPGSKFVRAESLPRCSTVPAASFNEGFYKVALICVFEARLHRATSQKPHHSANQALSGPSSSSSCLARTNYMRMDVGACSNFTRSYCSMVSFPKTR